MTVGPNPLANVSMPVFRTTVKPSRSVALFSRRMEILWALVALLTVTPELLPNIRMPFAFFCAYYLIKAISFFALGFLAPLAFRSLNGIRLGMICSFLSAFLIEIFQGLLHTGHVFHWYELAGKLSFIALGFACALDCRYELKLSLGPLKVQLLNQT